MNLVDILASVSSYHSRSHPIPASTSLYLEKKKKNQQPDFFPSFMLAMIYSLHSSWNALF